MFSRRVLVAICIAAVFSPLNTIAQAISSTDINTPTTTATDISTTTPTTSESVSPPTSTPTSSTTSSIYEPTPSTDPTDSLGYYLSIPGKTYENATQSETTAEESAAGADGDSDTFINIPLGAQIAIISIVVIAGIAGLVFGWFWYQRRRRQWEIQGRRRSLVPRISRSVNGFSMSRPVYIRDSLAATPIIAVPPSAHRASSGTASVSSFNQVDLEKGNERSEFENESKPAVWKSMFSGK